MALGRQKGSSCSEAGQILLIVILVIIVVSTVGLSLASRSITSLRTSTEEAESQKALAAAEAGIERTIQSNNPTENASSKTPILDSEGKTNSYYQTKVTSVNGASFLIDGGNMIPKDEGVDVWFIGHSSVDSSLDYSNYSLTNPSSVNLYWGSSDQDCSSSNKPAAIEVIIVTKSVSGTVISYRYVYDSCSRGNGFASASNGSFPIVSNGVTYNFKYATPMNSLLAGIPSPKNVILMRVIPIYKDTTVGISSDIALPTQGYTITSTGTSNDATHTLTVFKGYPQTYLPFISYGLFVAAN